MVAISIKCVYTTALKKDVDYDILNPIFVFSKMLFALYTCIKIAV